MISLIIPTLNEEKSLRYTLQSLIDELGVGSELEIIVSDGGSTDNTIALAKSMGVVLVKPKPGEKQNIAIGRNAGAAVAKGEVLIFLDADTFPKNWGKLLQAVKNTFTDQAVVAATVSVEVEPAARKWRDVIWQNLFNLVFFTENALGIAMGRGNCQIVRAKTFCKIGGYNVNLAAAEDYDLYRRLARVGKIKILWHVIVYESPRRFRRYGYLKVVWWWTLNGLNVFLRNQAWSKQWRRVK